MISYSCPSLWSLEKLYKEFHCNFYSGYERVVPILSINDFGGCFWIINTRCLFDWLDSLKLRTPHIHSPLLVALPLKWTDVLSASVKIRVRPDKGNDVFDAKHWCTALWGEGQFVVREIYPLLRPVTRRSRQGYRYLRAKPWFESELDRHSPNGDMVTRISVSIYDFDQKIALFLISWGILVGWRWRRSRYSKCVHNYEANGMFRKTVTE